MAADSKTIDPILFGYSIATRREQLVYELVEWGLSIGLSPEDAENYNGQQGDMWDAHKDMFLATIGAIFTGLFLWLHQQKKHSN